MRKSLIFGIILAIICLGLTFYYEIKKTEFINIHEITNKGLKDEKVDVYLDATFVAGTISNNNISGYYVMFGDGVQYIVYMENITANKINKYLLDNPESSYRIEGMTKLIPSSLEGNGKKFVKEWLDNNHNHEGEEVSDHDHNITNEEFYEYFGYVYLDSTVDNYSLVRVFIYLTGILGALLIVAVILKSFNL